MGLSKIETAPERDFPCSLLSLKTAVEPLLVLDLPESADTRSCLGFDQFGAWRSSP
jgi:hypothetical protein